MNRTILGSLGAATLGSLLAGALTLGMAGQAAAAAGELRLNPGEQLNAGQRLVSQDGRYVLVMQGDGNLVEYAPGNRAIWSSGTSAANSVALMQRDGNFVVIAPGNRAVWSTRTSGNPGADLELQNDANLVVYGAGHTARWASGSGAAATNPKAESAINWFTQRLGSTAYEHQCEKAVENAYGVTAKYLTARLDWQHRDQHQPYSAAPRGALVFYDTSADGHVAISLGDGRLVSTSVGGKIGIVAIGYFQRPLGWAPSPW